MPYHANSKTIPRFARETLQCNVSNVWILPLFRDHLLGYSNYGTTLIAIC